MSDIYLRHTRNQIPPKRLGTTLNGVARFANDIRKRDSVWGGPMCPPDGFRRRVSCRGGSRAPRALPKLSSFRRMPESRAGGSGDKRPLAFFDEVEMTSENERQKINSPDSGMRRNDSVVRSISSDEKGVPPGVELFRAAREPPLQFHGSREIPDQTGRTLSPDISPMLGVGLIWSRGRLFSGGRRLWGMIRRRAAPGRRFSGDFRGFFGVSADARAQVLPLR